MLSDASLVENDREHSVTPADDTVALDRAQFINAIEALPAGFVLFDENGDLLYCNQTQKDFYPHVADIYHPGTNRHDILVRHAKTLSQKDANLDIEKYIADRVDLVLSARPDAETQLADGRWVKIRERVISGGGLVSIRTDISDRKKSEADLVATRVELENHIAALKESKESLERQTLELSRLAEEQAALNAKLAHEVAVKDTFFSIVSHDLRNPFTPILGLTRLMAESADDISTEKLILFAKGVNTASEQYFGILEKLLQWSRSQMSGVQLQPEALSVQKLAQEAIDLLSPMALEKSIRLTLQDTKNTAFADAGMTQSVIQNLITNAVKFTPEGGAVEVSAQAHDDMVQVTVSDTGIGIPMDKAEKVFALDHKTSTTGTGGETGSGLGLPLCKDLVEKNGGRIWYESGAGDGTRFHFTLPTEQARA
jgi:signal transduction histidine kinase